MENSPLRCLPREIRDEVYTYILTQSQPIQVHLTPGETNYFGKSVYRSNLFNVASLCRQFCQESEPIFWASNSFVITLDEIFLDDCYSIECPSVRRFINAAGLDNLRRIRNLRLQVLFGRNAEQAGKPLQISVHSIMGSLPKTYLQLDPECAALWKEAWTFSRLIHPRATMDFVVRMGFLDLAMPFHDSDVAHHFLKKIGIQRLGGRLYDNERHFDQFWNVVKQSVFQPRIIDMTPRVVLFK